MFVYSRHETTLCTDSLLFVTGNIRLAHGYSICMRVWRPGFDPRAGHVGFVMCEVAMGKISSQTTSMLYQYNSTNAPYWFHPCISTVCSKIGKRSETYTGWFRRKVSILGGDIGLWE